MKDEPRYEEFYERWAQAYDSSNYERGLAAYLMRRGHAMLEKKYNPTDHFGSVLEVGAGSGVHFAYVRHSYDKYTVTDASELILSKARHAIHRREQGGRGEVIFDVQNASQLSFANETFDRVIATHVLEHIPDPHVVLREWVRVLKPGGTLSLLQPCDPGVLWRLGRNFGPRSSAEKAGIAYDYWMAREHINSIHNIVSLIHYYFDVVHETWYPIRVPSTDLNLFYCCHIEV